MIHRLLLLLCFCGCTQNIRARNLGGTATVTLPCGQKLLNATWKDSDLWILRRDMRPGEVAESYVFAEDSAYGALEGKIILKECGKGAETP